MRNSKTLKKHPVIILQKLSSTQKEVTKGKRYFKQQGNTMKRKSCKKISKTVTVRKYKSEELERYSKNGGLDHWIA